MMNKAELMEKINNTKTRSAWERGVKQYALDIIDNRDEKDSPYTEKDLLNGAPNWKEYSYSGSALCYDMDIARRLCAPWELKKTDGGTKEPNKRESWLDVQARALYQASYLIRHCYD